MKIKPRFINLVLMFVFVFSALGFMPRAVRAQPTILINEVDADTPSYDVEEFIELFDGGSGGTSLDGLVLVFFNGNGDVSYNAFDLDGYVTNTNGYFVLCGNASNVVNCDLDVGINQDLIQNGADAIALYMDEASNFPSGTPVTTTNLLDALVYDTDDDDDAGLLILLNEGQPQVNENGGGNKDYHSNQRCPNGSGGVRNTDTFTQFTPTPGTENCVIPLSDPVINEFSASTVGTDVEYVEILGDPVADYSAYTVLEIEGDSGSAIGTIDGVIPLGTTDGNGFYLADLPANALENGTISLLLVKDFSGAEGEDIDTNDDGIIDYAPWSALVDSIAVNDGGAGDITYGTPVLTVSYDGLPYAPGGASRIPDGYDTDSPSDWVRNDFDLGGISGYEGSLVLGEAYNTPGEPNRIYETCGSSFTPIFEIQGDGMATPLSSPLATEGIVVGDFQEGGKNGFFIQDPVGDGDPTTSDGIFVFAPGSMDVSVGDYVRVNGTPTEYYGLTQIGSVTEIWLCDEAQPLPPPVELVLPVASLGAFEPFEGMYVTFPQDLVISEYYNYDRYGEIVLSSSRLITPTALVEPGPAATTLAQEYLLDRITLDDGSSYQNPDFSRHPNGLAFDLYNRFRGGDLLTNVTGVLDYGFNLYRIQPTQGANYTPANPRTSEPDIVEGDIKIASLNVLNYFTTLDSGPDICGPVLFVDVIGKLGEDPGSYWGTEPNTTKEHTLVRKENVCSGDKDWHDDFDPAAEWNSFEQDYFDDLSTHTTTCAFDDLIISEYIEGSSNNKAIEIYNGTGAPVDLQGYTVALYSNGSTSPSSTLTWTTETLIPDGGTYVIANASAHTDILAVADTTSTVTYFNGDDVVALQKAGTGGMECRGADDVEEFERQREKILAALATMDADVVGLIEIENDRPGPEPDYPVADLVEGLNDLMGAGTYDYIPTGPIGTDAIKVALIYKPGAVTPMGDYAILDVSVDPRFLDDYNRPVLAQTFMDNIVGESITVAVNHLKSKGSDCNAIGDPDIGDGQGNCNLTRLAAAQAEISWLASDPTGTGIDKYLIIGDLNSYDKEDPIDAIKTGPDGIPGTNDDFVDLIYEILGEDAYSYVFDGQTGYLDYAMANILLAPFVTDMDVWHINADEPDLLDYDTSFKSPAQDLIYAPDAYRASDHDPVIVTLTFNKQPIAMDDYYEANQDITLVVDDPLAGVLANDYDLNLNDVITLDVWEQPSHGVLTLNHDGTFTYVPDPGYFGEDHFVYLMMANPPSRGEFSDTATVFITVHSKYKYYFPIAFND